MTDEERAIQRAMQELKRLRRRLAKLQEEVGGLRDQLGALERGVNQTPERNAAWRMAGLREAIDVIRGMAGGDSIDRFEAIAAIKVLMRSA